MIKQYLAKMGMVKTKFNVVLLSPFLCSWVSHIHIYRSHIFSIYTMATGCIRWGRKLTEILWMVKGAPFLNDDTINFFANLY